MRNLLITFSVALLKTSAMARLAEWDEAYRHYHEHQLQEGEMIQAPHHE